jgi:MFS family permease
MGMAEEGEFSLRQIAVPAFGPSAIWSIGAGAVLPVVALSARGLGASVAVAALFVGLAGVAEIAAAVPAGVLVERIGERRAIALAGLVDAAACLLALVAPSLVVLGLAVMLMGPSAAIFLLARQSYLTAAAPVALRARAMSTLGGVTRIGLFIGPLVGAPVVARWGPQGAFGVAVGAGLLASVLAWRATDLTAHEESGAGIRARVPVTRVVAEHRRVLLTVGLGVLGIGLARASRVVVVPLWAEHIGLDAAQTSLVFAAAALVEVVLFWPAGTVMDRHGRVWVAVPVALLLGGGCSSCPRRRPWRGSRSSRSSWAWATASAPASS